MRDVKLLLILVSVFMVLFSCSLPRSVVAQKERVSYRIVEKPTTIRDTVYQTRGLSSELREYLESTLKDYKTDNLKQVSNIETLKRFIDSLARENKNMFRINSQLAFSDILNQRRMLESRELLLIEREKRASLQKENVVLTEHTDASERYTSILLITGVIANLLMTVILYFYKRKQIQELKKLNLLHA